MQTNGGVDDDAGQQSHQDLDHHLGLGHGSHHPKHIILHAEKTINRIFRPVILFVVLHTYRLV